MLENVMNSMGGGIEIFGLISICMFFVFFTGILIWATRLKKSYVESMCELPLEREPGKEDAKFIRMEERHE